MKTLFNKLNAKSIDILDTKYYAIKPLADEFGEEPNTCCYLLNHLQSLNVIGEKAAEFLQGQLTIDISKVDSPSLGAYCNIKGRIISLFYCVKISNKHFKLIMPSQLINSTQKKLIKYGAFSKVSIAPSSEVIGLYKDMEHRDFLFLNDKTLENDLSKINAPLFGSISYHYRQLLNHIPSLYLNTQNHWLPHKIGLDRLNAIDVKKGCYLGQEIIARMHFKGKQKYGVSHFISEEALLPGDKIERGNQTIGDVIDICPTLDNKTLVLGSILLSYTRANA